MKLVEHVSSTRSSSSSIKEWSLHNTSIISAWKKAEEKQKHFSRMVKWSVWLRCDALMKERRNVSSVYAKTKCWCVGWWLFRIHVIHHPNEKLFTRYVFFFFSLSISRCFSWSLVNCANEDGEKKRLVISSLHSIHVTRAPLIPECVRVLMLREFIRQWIVWTRSREIVSRI